MPEGLQVSQQAVIQAPGAYAKPPAPNGSCNHVYSLLMRGNTDLIACQSPFSKLTTKSLTRGETGNTSSTAYSSFTEVHIHVIHKSV